MNIDKKLAKALRKKIKTATKTDNLINDLKALYPWLLVSTRSLKTGGSLDITLIITDTDAHQDAVEKAGSRIGQVWTVYTLMSVGAVLARLDGTNANRTPCEVIKQRPLADCGKTGMIVLTALKGDRGSAVRADLLTLCIVLIAEPEIAEDLEGMSTLKRRTFYRALVSEDGKPTDWTEIAASADDFRSNEGMMAKAEARLYGTGRSASKDFPVSSGTHIPKRPVYTDEPAGPLTPLNAGGGSKYSVKVSDGGSIGAIGDNAVGTITNTEARTWRDVNRDAHALLQSLYGSSNTTDLVNDLSEMDYNHNLGHNVRVTSMRATISAVLQQIRSHRVANLYADVLCRRFPRNRARIRHTFSLAAFDIKS